VVGSPIWGGTTGKISGYVYDAETGEPLVGANVIVEETSLGAASDAQGYYAILNVPPGRYTVKAMMIGYTSVRSVGVKVSVDFTTEVNFQLSPTSIEMGAVAVVAERPIIRKDLTSSLSIVGDEEIAEMPVEEFDDVLSLQAGIVVGADGQIHLRGGRSSEIAYLVDGVSVTDPFSGDRAIEVENTSIQELQVISGTFNAEYGQAMSGIVDIVTKEGGERLRGDVNLYTGDYLSTGSRIFTYIDRINPNSITNLQVSLDGPVPFLNGKLTFFLTGRFYDSRGWLYGIRRFLPSDSSNFENWFPSTDDVGADSLPGTGDPGEGDGSPTPGEPNVYVEQSGDGAYVPMNPLIKFSTQGKLTYRLTPSIKISYSFFWDRLQYREYDHLFKLNPEGDYRHFKLGYSQALIWNHALSSKTFYTVKFGDTFFDYKRYVYRDPLDPRYVDPKRLDDARRNAFKTGGTKMWHLYRNSRTMLAKVDFTSQIHPAHQIKTGIEFRRHELFFHEFEIIPKKDEAGKVIRPFEPAVAIPTSIANNRYRHFPVEAAAYIQDKIELQDMIVNVGIRFDYFNANAKVPIDLRDPDNAKYFMVLSPVDSSIRMVRMNDYTSSLGAVLDTVNVRGNDWKYNYRMADPALNLGPRIGISYPITDRGVIHFSYGHFSQIPTFEQLYANSEFEVWAGSLSSIMGNASLKPQRTVIYELGIQQQLSDDIGIDITGFYKDMRYLLGMELVTTYTQDVYARFINRDYGNVRGVTVALEKRRSNYLSASVDYTFQVAEGNASDPMQAFYDAKNNKESEIQVIPLDWDQTHTLNFSVTVSDPGQWGLSLIGRIGSGLPYTPKVVNVGESFQNSERKPPQYTFDFKAHKEFSLGGRNVSLFLKVYNLLDRRNEIQVYSDTGRAGYTIEPRGTVRGVNTLEEYLTRPDWYSEPRRILLGISMRF
jgi:hypothetical protein